MGLELVADVVFSLLADSIGPDVAVGIACDQVATVQEGDTSYDDGAVTLLEDVGAFEEAIATTVPEDQMPSPEGDVQGVVQRVKDATEGRPQ